MQSVLTRLVGSVRAVLLIPCLLIGLACATPFPIEDLEKGMTEETVRENFGAPVETNPGSVTSVSSWTYVNEAQKWPTTIMPAWLLSIPILAAWPGARWDELYVYKWPVKLYFEADKLVHWVDLKSLGGPQGTSGGPHDMPPLPPSDIWHHAQGHIHHHGH